MPDSDLATHYKQLIRAITMGRLIPLFGAGVNLCDRAADADWHAGGDQLPSGGELSEHLAETYAYPDRDPWNLARVSQYIAVESGTGPLYDDLREIFNENYPLTSLHQFFARLPRTLKEKGYKRPNQLIITTNYDDLMERAYREANQDFDVVSYIADSEDDDEIGKFIHWRPDGSSVVIERPNEYRDVSLDERPVVLKIHGAIDRETGVRDSYVITEDHYIDYLTQTDIAHLVPVTLAARLRKSHLLFLGYGLADWNLRVILNRIWGNAKLSYKSWAVKRSASSMENKFWSMRGVDIHNAELKDYIAGLAEQIHAIEPQGGGA